MQITPAGGICVLKPAMQCRVVLFLIDMFEG